VIYLDQFVDLLDPKPDRDSRHPLDRGLASAEVSTLVEGVQAIFEAGVVGNRIISRGTEA
jgi:hypothetical protein